MQAIQLSSKKHGPNHGASFLDERCSPSLDTSSTWKRKGLTAISSHGVVWSLCLMKTCLTSWKASMCKTTRRPSLISRARRSRVRWQRNAMQKMPAERQRPDPAQRKLMPHLQTKQSPRRHHSSRPHAQRKLKLHRIDRGAGTVIIMGHDVTGLAGMHGDWYYRDDRHSRWIYWGVGLA